MRPVVSRGASLIRGFAFDPASGTSFMGVGRREGRGPYSHFEAEVLARIRRKTFGEDFGQNSWTTAEECRHWAGWLDLQGSSHVLEVASGSGGPAIFLAELSGARVTGIDVARREDATENAATVSKRWYEARAEDHDALVRIEGQERYAGLQRFFSAVHVLTSERRLSRFVYMAQKRAT